MVLNGGFPLGGILRAERNFSLSFPGRLYIKNKRPGPFQLVPSEK